MEKVRTGLVPLTLLLCLVVAPPIAAQEATEEAAAEEAEVEKNWSNEGSLAWVNTSGNAATTTFAITDTFKYNWTYSEFVFNGEYFRATARNEERFNEGGGVRQVFTTETTAKYLDLNGTFRQNILNQMYWYGMGSYFQNRPAGIDSRLFANGGVGNRFIENSTTLLLGEIGLGVTRENPVDTDGDTFLDARAYVEFGHQINDNTKIELSSEFMDNLQNVDQLRINAHAGVTAQMSSVFALRVSWDLRFNNAPPFVIVDTNPDEEPVPFQLKTSDRTLAASLVFTF
jgi:putative salt-induced outer membrane protein YdiY